MGDLAENVRAKRTERGWSQSELADLTGLRSHTIYRIEARRTDGSARTLLALSRAFQVDPFELCGLPPLGSEAAA